jgi:Cft2 family RNA processing exonuclease
MALPYGEVYQGEGYRLKFYPAGHVLGSAMARVETDAGESFLYTGDFKTRKGLSAEAIDIPQADTIVMETTFGRSDYVFPDFEETCQRIHAFCDRATAEKKTPVLLAYSLGKAQELMKIVESRSQALMVYKTIAVLKKLPRKDCLIAMVSGWGMNDSAKYRYGVDEVIPLSDHADYPDLLKFVDAAKPKAVYTTHGYEKEFAATLRQRGYEAWSLSGDDQLELTL